MKLCKDCKWKFNNNCKNPHNFKIQVSPVLGNTIYLFRHNCHTLRKYGWLEARLVCLCGKEGRWYERSNM